MLPSLTGDGIYDFSDLTLLLNEWLIDTPPPLLQFDLNEDGLVNYEDYGTTVPFWMTDTR